MAGQRQVGCLGPKIVDLLARPEAAGALEELDLAAELRVSPSQLRGATTETRYVYDDQGRLIRSITSSPWGSEDRALMLARNRVHAGRHRDCHQPVDHAMHPKNDSVFYDVTTRVCHPCTAIARAINPSAEPVRVAVRVVDTRDYDEHPLPPLTDDDFD